jgi:hypothetical protein
VVGAAPLRRRPFAGSGHFGDGAGGVDRGCDGGDRGVVVPAVHRVMSATLAGTLGDDYYINAQKP